MDTARSSAHRTIALVGGPGSGKTTLRKRCCSAPARSRDAAPSSRGRRRRPRTGGDRPRHDTRARPRRLTWTVGDVECGVTLIDTPGHPDFVGAVDAALAVADVAVIVVSAVDGVTGGTRTAWAAPVRRVCRAIVVVTQEDRARADFRRSARAAAGGVRCARSGRSSCRSARSRSSTAIADILERARTGLRRRRPPSRRGRCRPTWPRTRSTACTRR